jgi:hypothetical protein
MKKSAHETAVEQAVSDAGGQHYRREVEQPREGDVEDERDAGREWLRHVEAGRIGPPPDRAT